MISQVLYRQLLLRPRMLLPHEHRTESQGVEAPSSMKPRPPRIFTSHHALHASMEPALRCDAAPSCSSEGNSPWTLAISSWMKASWPATAPTSSKGSSPEKPLG